MIFFASKHQRLALAAFTALLAVGPLVASAPLLAQEVQRIDEQSTWMFRAKSGVVVHSTIIRLADVAEPVGSQLAAWNRLRGSVIALIPVGQTSVTVRRDRLAAAISRAEATPARIDWIGPANIDVSYVEASPETPAQFSADPTNRTQSPRMISDRLDPIVLSRLDTWIGMALNRGNPELAKRYEIKLSKSVENAAAIQSLEDAGGIVHASFDQEFARDAMMNDPGAASETISQSIFVTGRSIAGPIDTKVKVELKPHPLAVAPKHSLRRGHVISATDLTQIPVPEKRWREDYASDVDQVVGLEVTGSNRVGQPLSTRSVDRPLLIRRGDLIEVRVLGGGIAVTTNAKALGDGHKSQLIEVETSQPRRRLVARVAGNGLAEIVTRAPVVR